MNRIKKFVAGATLAVSLGGGGALLAANSAHMIASTADAGQALAVCILYDLGGCESMR